MIRILIIASFIVSACGSLKKSEEEHVVNCLQIEKTKMRIGLNHVDERDKKLIVWVIRPGDDQFRKLGFIDPNKEKDGEYCSKIPFKEFYMIVTPEDSTQVRSPTGPVVYEQTIML